MTRFGPLLALIVISGMTLAAQQTTPGFEVASIRPSGDSTADDRSDVQPSGVFVVTNTTLDNLELYLHAQIRPARDSAVVRSCGSAGLIATGTRTSDSC